MISFWINVFFATFFAKKNKLILNEPKSLAIIFDEAIGDYILFRNFLKTIRESKKYSDYKITFICNSIVKELVLFLDSEYIDNYIWIDIAKLKKNTLYRYYTLISLSHLCFTELLIPSDSRNVLTSDMLALAIQSEKKVSMITSKRNIGENIWDKKQSEITQKWYTNLLPVDYSNVKFAFDIRRIIISSIIEEKINDKCPEIILPPNYELPIHIEGKYIVWALGASSKQRLWSTNHILETINYILNKSDYYILITGGLKDNRLATEVMKKIDGNNKHRVLNYCGKITLIDMLYLINKSNIIIGNDSCAIHMAMALEATGAQKEVFIIFPGKVFTRFVPYPLELSEKYHVIAHPEFEEKIITGMVKYDIFLNLTDTYPTSEIPATNLINYLNMYL